ncbi:MAG: gamma-glutamylcyclotransferase, partial [Candidatus Thioglobus sp.]
TADELAQSDEYEVDEYQRVLAKLKSGKQAWVYVSASDNASA